MTDDENRYSKRNEQLKNTCQLNGKTYKRILKPDKLYNSNSKAIGVGKQNKRQFNRIKGVKIYDWQCKRQKRMHCWEVKGITNRGLENGKLITLVCPLAVKTDDAAIRTSDLV